MSSSNANGGFRETPTIIRTADLGLNQSVSLWRPHRRGIGLGVFSSRWHGPARRQTMGHSAYDSATKGRPAWNAGRRLGAKGALKPQQVWAIRFWLDRERRVRDRAMFDLAIDSKLRGCDIVKLRIRDLVSGGRVRTRVIIIQRKTGRPVQFQLLEPARTGIRRGWRSRVERPTTMRSRAGSTASRISAPSSMRAWPTSGSRALGCGAKTTGLIPCVERRRHCFTNGPATCVPFRSCRVTPRLRAQSGTSVSTSRTHSR